MPITHYLPRNPSTATVPGPPATISSRMKSPGAATLEPAISYTPPPRPKGGVRITYTIHHTNNNHTNQTCSQTKGTTDITSPGL